MKFKVSANLKYPWQRVLQMAGYYSLNDGFVRRAGTDFYPRWHIYLQAESTEWIQFSIHLDQRASVHQGATAHSADYDGENVKQEIYRVLNFFNNNYLGS